MINMQYDHETGYISTEAAGSIEDITSEVILAVKKMSYSLAEEAAETPDDAFGIAIEIEKSIIAGLVMNLGVDPDEEEEEKEDKLYNDI